MRRKGRVPASETHRESPFGARRTGGAGEDHLGAGGLNLSKPLRTPPLPGRLEWPWSFPAARRVVPQRMFRLCLFRGTEAFSFLKGAASMTAPNVDALWRRGRCTPKNTPSGLNRNYGFSAVRRTWWSWGPTVTIPPVCLPGTRFPNFPIRCSAGTAA